MLRFFSLSELDINLKTAIPGKIRLQVIKAIKGRQIFHREFPQQVRGPGRSRRVFAPQRTVYILPHVLELVHECRAHIRLIRPIIQVTLEQKLIAGILRHTAGQDACPQCKARAVRGCIPAGIGLELEEQAPVLQLP